MIIVLNGADFSANNIGKIEIPKVPSSNVVALNNAITRELTKSQMIAIDDFIESLQSNNIWDKIEQLYIPSMAYTQNGDVKDCFIDIKASWGNEISYNSEIESKKANYRCLNGGIANINTDFSYVEINKGLLVSKNIQNVEDCHVLIYNINYNSAQRTTNVFLQTEWNKYCPNIYIEDTNAIRFLVSSSTLSLTGSIDNAVIGLSTSSNNANAVYGENSKTVPLSEFGSDINGFTSPTYFGPQNTNQTIGLISTGKGFDLQTLLKYKECINKLMSKIL